MARVQNGIETFHIISTGLVGCMNITNETTDRRVRDNIYPNVT